jgi:hypothetical protein
LLDIRRAERSVIEVALECGGVDERLEGGSALALRLRRAVEVALGKVAAAHHGAHRTRLRIHRDERALQVIGAVHLPLALVGVAAAVLDRRDAVLDRLFRRPLQVRVHRRVHAEAAFRDTRAAEPFDQVLAHLLLEVEAEALLHLEAVGERDLGLLRAIVLCRVDRFRRHHRLQDDVAARDRAIEIHGRGITRGRLDEPREKRRLFDREIARMLAEVPARGRLDAVEAIAEVHLVQVHLEDVVLGVDALDVRGEDDLLQLAAERLVAREEALARELLRDGAAPFGAAAFLQVVHDRGGDADEVDAVVLVKALVLDRDDRLDEIGGDAPERDFDPLLLEDREDRGVVRIINGRGLRHFSQVADGVPAGEPGREVVRKPGRGARRGEQDQRHQHDSGRERAGFSSEPRPHRAQPFSDATHSSKLSQDAGPRETSAFRPRA